MTRPDGQTIDPAYDSAGRLASITTATGATTFAYDPTTGDLASVTAPGGEILSYGYDGSLPTTTTWTGTVAGSVSRTYQFGCTIVQSLVFEIVGDYDPEADWLPFLLTESPLSDVSEELVSPRELDGPDADVQFRENAARIAGFLRFILAEHEVVGIDLFVSDALHAPYPTRTIAPDSIERELLAEWERREETDFSFCLVIAKAVGA